MELRSLQAFSGAVLAGGSSRRMGSDKAMLELPDGRLLAELAIDALIAAGAESISVVGGDPATVARRDARYLRDEHPGEGPLGALITALRNAREDVVFVMACDLVAPDARAIQQVLAEVGEADVSAALSAEIIQPLHAGWRRGCLAHLERCFAGGMRSPTQALGGLRVVQVSMIDASALADADTPEQLSRHTQMGADDGPHSQRPPDEPTQ